MNILKSYFAIVKSRSRRPIAAPLCPKTDEIYLHSCLLKLSYMHKKIKIKKKLRSASKYVLKMTFILIKMHNSQ